MDQICQAEQKCSEEDQNLIKQLRNEVHEFQEHKEIADHQVIFLNYLLSINWMLFVMYSIFHY